MDATTFASFARVCAPAVHPATAQALAMTESSLNPYAIGVVGGVLLRQPRSQAQALATARQLQAQGWNFSLGLAQINVHNLTRVGLTLSTAFDPCASLQAMQTLLLECFARALGASPQHPTTPPTAAPSASAQPALRRALSCYYSGNFSSGFTHGYVQRVARAAPAAPPPHPSPPPPPLSLWPAQPFKPP